MTSNSIRSTHQRRASSGSSLRLKSPLDDRAVTMAEFEGYLRTVNNRDKRPYEEKTIVAYLGPARTRHVDDSERDRGRLHRGRYGNAKPVLPGALPGARPRRNAPAAAHLAEDRLRAWTASIPELER